jgi:hypothetical protein
MNLERMLDLAIESKINPPAIDEMISIIRSELAQSIAKQSGKKDVYNAVKKYIKHIHKYHKGARESLECLSKESANGKYYISDSFGVVEFNNIDINDLPIGEDDRLGKMMLDLINTIQKRNDIEVVLPSEKEILLSYKLQLAEQKNNNDYTIYIKIGDNYYNPDLLSKLLSMMGDNIIAYAWSEKKNRELYLVDELGNRALMMPLAPDAPSFHLRESA